MYIARQNENHFVPLLRVAAFEEDPAHEFLGTSVCDADEYEDDIGDHRHDVSCISDSEKVIRTLDCVEKTRALLANEVDSVGDADVDADDVGDGTYGISSF